MILSTCDADRAPVHKLVSNLRKTVVLQHTIIQQIEYSLWRTNSDVDPSLAHRLYSFPQLDVFGE